MGNRGDVINEQWEWIDALFPKAKTKRGRPAESNVDREVHFIATTVRAHQHPAEQKSSPKRLVADKGCTSAAFRNYLHHRNIRCTIPHRRKEHHAGTFNKQLYRKRNIIERLINRLKQFRHITTHYEKRTANFSAMITLA